MPGMHNEVMVIGHQDRPAYQAFGPFHSCSSEASMHRRKNMYAVQGHGICVLSIHEALNI